MSSIPIKLVFDETHDIREVAENLQSEILISVIADLLKKDFIGEIVIKVK